MKQSQRLYLAATLMTLVAVLVAQGAFAGAPAGTLWAASRLSANTVALVLDDGTAEQSFGASDAQGNSLQFIWLNRFTPLPSEFPFSLDEIQVLFPDPAFSGIQAGDAVDQVVYEDRDGKPAKRAVWRGTFPRKIKVANGVTWSVYKLSAPVTFSTPGDVLIGVINRGVVSGETPGTFPAAQDSTSSQARSWYGLWTTDPPDPAVLPPTTAFS